MKTSLDHLRSGEQTKLAAIVQLIRDAAEVEMVILYGSYARGDHVRLDVETGYRSDFDILVVTKTQNLAEKLELWSDVEARAEALPGMPEVSLIAHDIAFVRKKIENGAYFFNDIRNEGVLLFDSGHHKLPAARFPTGAARKQQAEEDFDEWMETADQFMRGYEFHLGDGAPKLAAFNLHQATERYYAALLLVFTAYKPRIHNIEKLGKQASDLAPALRDVFPRGTPENDALFKKLKDAYVDARYKKSYRIDEAELGRLAGYVRKLRESVEGLCREKMATLG